MSVGAWRSIHEAQTSLSNTEVQKLLAYRNKRGSFNMMHHIERASAVATKIALRDNKTPLWEFMPHADKPFESQESVDTAELTPEQIRVLTASWN